MRRTIPLSAVALILGSCLDRDPEVAREPPLDLGPSLEATFEDPLLLTFAAARPRAEYLVDQGYTLTRSPDGVVFLATGASGDWGLAFETEGGWEVRARARLQHTTSDGMVANLTLPGELAVEWRFVASTSRAATSELIFTNSGKAPRALTVLSWLRRCEAPYQALAAFAGGVSMRHQVEPDLALAVFGPGTYVTDLVGALVADSGAPDWRGLSSCSGNLAADLASLAATAQQPRTAAMVGIRLPVLVPAGGQTRVRLRRALTGADEAASLLAALDRARQWSVASILRAGAARLRAIPELPGLSREQALVYRSSFVLLDQLMMPAEGRLGHDYFLFSREPTFWFGRLGEHIHEGLAMILLARLDPRAAMDALRVFMDRVEADGYLPYNIGPVVEQTALRTASAPLFSYVASEVAAETRDRDFLRQAYETGAKLHRFWREQRDVDGDGLCEWGGYGKTESVRDLENVIWENVADPHLLEGLDCNSFLVMEEKSLARMAAALGLAAEAAEWTARAEARAALVNALMWDEETGFYYHVTRDGHSMSHRAPGDLKRMEVQGFLPLWAGIVPPARLSRILSRLTDPSLFWRDFGVTGLAVNDPYYSPEPSRCCRWNGPVWVPWQFLLMRGLLGVGEVERARELTAKTLAAVAAQLKVVHQFRELYHPDDARVANRSMPNYIWSAMAALMLLETTENR